MPSTLSHAFAWWSSYYGEHQALSVTIRYLHLAALVVGGGAAITIDRQVVRVQRLPPVVRDATVTLLNSTHTVVVTSLAMLVATGVLMAGADIETYLVSPIFWTKMGLFALLLLNGAVLAQAGRRADMRADPSHRLIVTSIASVILWLVIVYASTWLMVAA
jgi:uncharacterized membrane protein